MTIYRMRPDRLEWRQVEGEVVVLDVKSSQYLALNSSGAVLWPMLSDGVTKDQMVAALVDAFEVDVATATVDVDAFIQDLVDKDLIIQ